ncbi:protein FAM169B [Octodon degus]|uniref:Protein FAM169B n=1 Tax=Octodon degus TaxID=10160 RepID=A0A6P6E6S7_OCTDE|nr:protein FAM169B [Octodon degus]
MRKFVSEEEYSIVVDGRGAPAVRRESWVQEPRGGGGGTGSPEEEQRERGSRRDSRSASSGAWMPRPPAGRQVRGPGIYPVDALQDDLEGQQEAALALAYYTSLGDGTRPSPEAFYLPTGEQVKLGAASVCLCTVYRDEPQHKILVLVNPQDTKTVVAVYLKESWWSTEDVLRTADPAREGLLKVQSFGERIVLFILNVIVFGRLERRLDDDDMFFLPHSMKEQAKILWTNGAAVGFYTTKLKGSLCGNGTSACYLLPVFDTVFVRRMHRRHGLGTAMLKDFCETFQEEEALGISHPISPAMFQVCRQFLLACPEERGRLWEVEPPGAWDQRVNIWLQVQLQQAGLPEAERWASPTMSLNRTLTFKPCRLLEAATSNWAIALPRGVCLLRATHAGLEPQLLGAEPWRRRRKESDQDCGVGLRRRAC